MLEYIYDLLEKVLQHRKITQISPFYLFMKNKNVWFRILIESNLPEKKNVWFAINNHKNS